MASIGAPNSNLASPTPRRTPDHPPYAEMIQAAIRTLAETEGSTFSSIDKYIKSEYHDLPWGHRNLFPHYLRKLLLTREIRFSPPDRFLLDLQQNYPLPIPLLPTPLPPTPLSPTPPPPTSLPPTPGRKRGRPKSSDLPLRQPKSSDLPLRQPKSSDLPLRQPKSGEARSKSSGLPLRLLKSAEARPKSSDVPHRRHKYGVGRPKSGVGRPKSGVGRPKSGVGRPKSGVGRPNSGAGRPKSSDVPLRGPKSGERRSAPSPSRRSERVRRRFSLVSAGEIEKNSPVSSDLIALEETVEPSTPLAVICRKASGERRKRGGSNSKGITGASRCEGSSFLLSADSGLALSNGRGRGRRGRGRGRYRGGVRGGDLVGSRSRDRRPGRGRVRGRGRGWISNRLELPEEAVVTNNLSETLPVDIKSPDSVVHAVSSKDPEAQDKLPEVAPEEIDISGNRSPEVAPEEIDISGDRFLEVAPEEIDISGDRFPEVAPEEIDISGNRSPEVAPEEIDISGDRCVGLPPASREILTHNPKTNHVNGDDGAVGSEGKVISDSAPQSTDVVDDHGGSLLGKRKEVESTGNGNMVGSEERNQVRMALAGAIGTHKCVIIALEAISTASAGPSKKSAKRKPREPSSVLPNLRSKLSSQ